MSVTTPNDDPYQQYLDSRDLLSTMIVERDQLLREVETLARTPRGKGTLERFVRFDIGKAQTLLFELSLRTNKIDTLIVLTNGYAERCGMPLVGLPYDET